jgi:hypothetical protein
MNLLLNNTEKDITSSRIRFEKKKEKITKAINSSQSIQNYDILVFLNEIQL